MGIILNQFLRQLKLENKRSSTILEYKRRITLLVRYMDKQGIKDFCDVNRDIILDFQKSLLQRNLSARTINGIISTTAVFFSWAEIEGLIERSPVPSRLHVMTHPKAITRISDENIDNFVSWINTLQENLRAAFYLMYGSGARVGEVANLRYSDVVLRDNRVFINISDAKWNSDRLIPIIDRDAADIVWRYHQSCQVTGEPLFRVSRRTLQTYATKFAGQTGIEFHCHLLRHTFASRLLEKGVPITTIQFLLGHKTVNMTAHYTQSAIIDVKDITPTIYQERGTILHERD